MCLHINILSANCDFWSILGPTGLPKWAPKWTLGVKIGTQLGSGGAQGAPRANFSRCLVNFGIIFGSPDGHFGALLGRFLEQTAANRSKAQQLIAASCSN